MLAKRENADEHNRIKAVTNFDAVWMLIAYVSIPRCILEYAPLLPNELHSHPLITPLSHPWGSCDQTSSRGLEIPMAPAEVSP